MLSISVAIKSNELSQAVPNIIHDISKKIGCADDKDTINSTNSLNIPQLPTNAGFSCSRQAEGKT